MTEVESINVEPCHLFDGQMRTTGEIRSMQFSSFVEKNLPQLERTVQINAKTEYPIKPSFPNDEWGWFRDQLGRLFVITPDYYLFQRYSGETGLVMSEREKISWSPAGWYYIDEIKEQWLSEQRQQHY